MSKRQLIKTFIKNNISKKRLIIFVAVFSFLVYWYFSVPKQLFNTPRSTVIYSSENKLLAARIADDGQWRFPDNDSVPYKFKQAIIHFEDRNFYKHYGISVRAIARALKQNIKEKRIVSGASTITMQIIRLSESAHDRTIVRKFLEVIKATRLEAKYSKDELLNFYASNAPFGGNVVGLEAAAWRYFSRPCAELSWAESSLLAVLPNAPSLINLGKNRTELLNKRNRLLKILFDKNIISKEDYELALDETIPENPIPLPQLDGKLLDRSIKEGMRGKQIFSTVNYDLQKDVLNIVDISNRKLLSNEINNMAAIVIEIETGNILAYVGNTEHPENAHNNYVDVASSPRSTGSILKPFLYQGMLNSGKLTPEMLVMDVPFFDNNYAPENYDKRFRGAVPAYEALARSLNVPTVQMLRNYSVPKFLHQLKQMGFSTITKSPEHYGLPLVLGGAEARLDEITSCYAYMAYLLRNYALGNDNSFSVGYNTIRRKNDFKYQMSASSIWYTFEALLRVARPDEDNNWQTFFSSQKIAWKTGTSFGFKDAWAVGVTAKYAVGIWVGNADGEGRPGLIGVEVAAPVLFKIFDALPKSEWFSFPYDDVTFQRVCVKSGHLASAVCDVTDSVWLPLTSLATSPCPYHQTIHLNDEGKRVSVQCKKNAENLRSTAWFVLPTITEKYYRLSHPDYQILPPLSNTCKEYSASNKIAVIYPKNNQKIYLPKNHEGKPQKFVIEATQSTHGTTLFWHVNEVFVAKTTDISQIEQWLKVGKYRLTIMDESGNETSCTFEVISN